LKYEVAGTNHITTAIAN